MLARSTLYFFIAINVFFYCFQMMTKAFLSLSLEKVIPLGQGLLSTFARCQGPTLCLLFEFFGYLCLIKLITFGILF